MKHEPKRNRRLFYKEDCHHHISSSSHENIHDKNQVTVSNLSLTKFTKSHVKMFVNSQAMYVCTIFHTRWVKHWTYMTWPFNLRKSIILNPLTFMKDKSNKNISQFQRVSGMKITLISTKSASYIRTSIKSVTDFTKYNSLVQIKTSWSCFK